MTINKYKRFENMSFFFLSYDFSMNKALLFQKAVVFLLIIRQVKMMPDNI